jgi:hypothetical protein
MPVRIRDRTQRVACPVRSRRGSNIGSGSDPPAQMSRRREFFVSRDHDLTRYTERARQHSRRGHSRARPEMPGLDRDPQSYAELRRKRPVSVEDERRDGNRGSALQNGPCGDDTNSYHIST